MPLRRFRLGNVRKGPKSFAKLKSIQTLLNLPFDNVFEHEPGLLRSNLYLLIGQRRRRINQLSTHECRKIRSRRLEMLNCPPSGAYVLPESRECRIDFFCPFCWMRNITGSVYDHFALQLFGTTRLMDNPPPICPALLTLLEKQSYLTVEDCANQTQLCEDIRHTARTIWQEEFADASFGAYTHAFLEPSGVANMYSVTERLLLIAPSGRMVQPIASAYGFSAKVLTAKQLCNFTFADMIGRACAYPSELMLGDVAAVADIINLRSRVYRGKRPSPLAGYWGDIRHVHTTYQKRQLYWSEYKENYGNEINADTGTAT